MLRMIEPSERGEPLGEMGQTIQQQRMTTAGAQSLPTGERYCADQMTSCTEPSCLLALRMQFIKGSQGVLLKLKMKKTEEVILPDKKCDVSTTKSNYNSSDDSPEAAPCNDTLLK
jgi:hypothetical protein